MFDSFFAALLEALTGVFTQSVLSLISSFIGGLFA